MKSPLKYFIVSLKFTCIQSDYDFEEDAFLGYKRTQFGGNPVFWRNILPPCLDWNSKPSKKAENVGG
jgi:hypothetical protein